MDTRVYNSKPSHIACFLQLGHQSTMVKIEFFVLRNPRWRRDEQVPHFPCRAYRHCKELEIMLLIYTVSHAWEMVYIRQRIHRPTCSSWAAGRGWADTTSTSRVRWIRGSNGGRTDATRSSNGCIKSHSFCAVAEKRMCLCKWLWESYRARVSCGCSWCRGCLAQDGSPFLSQFRDVRLWDRKGGLTTNNEGQYDIRELWHKKAVLRLPYETTDIFSPSLVAQTSREVLLRHGKWIATTWPTLVGT